MGLIKHIIVHVDEGTWDDLIGPDKTKPKYKLCAGRPVEYGDGIIAATFIGNHPEENS